jgi:hypothetical protein
LKTNRDSVDEMEATNLAQSLLGQRRATPVGTPAGVALPPFDTSVSIPKATPIFLTADGTVVTSASAARFGCIYRIAAPTAPAPPRSLTRVYLCLFWPPQAGADKAQGRYEIASTFTLP